MNNSENKVDARVRLLVWLNLATLSLLVCSIALLGITLYAGNEAYKRVRRDLTEKATYDEQSRAWGQTTTIKKDLEVLLQMVPASTFTRRKLLEGYKPELAK